LNLESVVKRFQDDNQIKMFWYFFRIFTSLLHTPATGCKSWLTTLIGDGV
jgi:hypothetical protein